MRFSFERQLIAIASIALSAGTASAALLFSDPMNDVGGNWRYWTGHFDQAQSVSGSFVSASTGKLVFAAHAGLTDALVSTDEFNQNISVGADVTLNATATGAFATLGIAGSTAGGSRVDFDLFESAGQWSIGIYDANAANYGASAVVLSPQPTLGTEYRLTGTRSGDNFTLTLTSIDGLTTLGTSNNTIVGAATIGMLYVKNQDAQASFDRITVVDSDSAAIDLYEDFASNAISLDTWFAEANPDVNEGGGGGMRIYNMAAIRIGGARPDFQTPGYMTIRGGAAAPSDNYCRVPTRFAPPNYPWYGNVDIMAKLRFDAGDTLFSLGLDNRTNEGQRRAILLDTATTGTRNGVANPSLHIVDNAAYPTTIGAYVQSAAVGASWNPSTTQDIYLYVQRNGNNVTAWLSNDAVGTILAGTQVVGSIAGANVSGQLVPTTHSGTTRIDGFAVWDYSTGWNTAVQNWEMF